MRKVEKRGGFLKYGLRKMSGRRVSQGRVRESLDLIELKMSGGMKKEESNEERMLQQ